MILRFTTIFTLAIPILLISLCIHDPGEVQWTLSTKDKQIVERSPILMTSIKETSYNRLIIQPEDQDIRQFE